LIVLLLFQDNSSEVLIEKLHSAKLEERTNAEKELQKLGVAVLPLLEKASRDSDPEVASRISRLLRVIPIVAHLSPNLMDVIPGIEDRLSSDDHSWTLAFLAASEGFSRGMPRYPGLTEEDLGALLHRAFRGARSPRETSAICRAVAFDRWRVRSATLEVLPLLQAENEEVKIAAIEALGSLRSREGSDEIIQLLEDPSVQIQISATDALAKVGATKSIPVLLRLLTTGETQLRAAVISALTVLGASDAIPHLTPLLKDTSGEVRQNTARAIGRLGGREQVSPLVALLTDEDDQVRVAAIGALAELGILEATPKIAPLLGDPIAQVRGSVALALGRLKASQCTEAIVRLLTDSDRATRRCAIVALTDLHASQYVGQLSTLLRDSDSNVRGYAARALAKLGAKDQVPALTALMERDSGYAGYCAVDALADLGANESIPKALTLVVRRNPEMQWLGVYALEQLGAKEALPELFKHLEERGTRESISIAVGFLGSPGMAQKLVPFLSDPQYEVRLTMAQAIGRMEAYESADEMRNLLKDHHPWVRGTAAASLCRMGMREGVPPLLQYASQSDRGRLNALNRLRSPKIWAALNARKLAVAYEGTSFQPVKEVADFLNVTLQIPRGESVCERYWSGIPNRTGKRGGCTSSLDAVDELLRYSPYDFILEPGSIRIVRGDEALEFWTSWWMAEQAERK
jgi:HEAT repeat protein